MMETFSEAFFWLDILFHVKSHINRIYYKYEEVTKQTCR